MRNHPFFYPNPSLTHLPFLPHKHYNEGMELCLKEVLKVAEWYETNKRELPWRDSGDPYDVLLSEIMLQQTRIESVKERFIAFKKVLPDILSLAEADDTLLMKLWEGMGYYSRARNLKKCAVEIQKKYQGKIPASKEELQKLPGIGPYTSGAISAIAYGRAAAAVDGNVLRVFARLYNDNSDIRADSTKKKYEASITSFYAAHELPPQIISDFTQGIMELGEVLCVPNGEPDCESCPLREFCEAYRQETTDSIPYRSSLKKRKIQERTLFIIHDATRVYLHQRPSAGLLADLYEFPGVEKKLSTEEAETELKKRKISYVQINALPENKHIFSHIEWHMQAFEVKCEKLTEKEGLLACTKEELSQYAIPSAFKLYKDLIFNQQLF